MIEHAKRPDVPGTDATKPVAAPPAAALQVPGRWHDPLRLIQAAAPDASGRIVLWTVSILVLILLAWAAVGKLDIIVSATGKLTPLTLVKIVQPAEAGIVQELLVSEGETVKAGQVLARLDTTLAKAERTVVTSQLAGEQMQVRRIEAELADQPMAPMPGDDINLYAQVLRQYREHRLTFESGLEQEQALLFKAQQDELSARETLSKLEQTLPMFRAAAANYAELSAAGYVPAMRTVEKQREAIEKTKELDAQTALVASFSAVKTSQQKKIQQVRSGYRSALQKELADIRMRIEQLNPNLVKSTYREGLMELRAPQDGVIKELATTTLGAVVQPGSVVLTLVPQGEQLFVDASIKNEDIGFVRVGQRAQVKLSAFPFQRHGMLSGKVIRIGPDSTQAGRENASAEQPGSAPTVSSYKVRVALDQQSLVDANGQRLTLAPGMDAVAEIHQGRRTVLDYLLSPVQKTMTEAGREK